MSSPEENLITIPFIDVREKGAIGIVEEHKAKTADLLAKSAGAFGWKSKMVAGIALPIGDKLSRRWLKKANNPYRDEIEKTAQIVGGKGVVCLNMCYEWGCTSGSFQVEPGKAPHLVRILDWPFPALGENTVVALQKGPAGEFHNVTWPGMSGCFNAVAHGRFAAALNQAPMRRHWTGIFIDWARNRHLINKQKALPPAHLLRHVFETAKDYAEAKKMLSTEPISIPVIYILTGMKEGEGCVIERTENNAFIREMQNGRVTAANHFESPLNGLGHGWMPRATNSHNRVVCAMGVDMTDISKDFEWFREPIANYESRLAMVAKADTGNFKVIGTAGVKPVTKVFRM
ncbi:MAG: hypothetical protein EPN97_01185 [Alphaproteobacteria bacterium]|nr:MAG: hypothetical protein EPN97_01185 [Alphaproteobacteria bacterium]